MKQRHAFADLHVHAVFKTWRRMPIIKAAEREEFLRRVVIVKAHEMDAGSAASVPVRTTRTSSSGTGRRLRSRMQFTT